MFAQLCPTVIQWAIACQDLPSLGFSRQEYWSGLPFPSPGDLFNPGMEFGSPALQEDSLPTELQGKPHRELPPPPPMSLGAMLPSPLANVILQEAPLSIEFSSKNTRVGCHSLLQGIFPIQGLNSGLLHCRKILYHLIHQENPNQVTVKSTYKQ